MLEKKLLKLNSFLRRYRNTVRRVFFLGLGVPVLCFHFYNNAIIKPKADEEVRAARLKGVETRETNEGTIYRENIKKKHINQIYDLKKGKFVTVYNSARHQNFYPFVSALIMAYALRSFYDEKKRPIVNNLDINGNVKKVGFELGGAGVVLCASANYLATLEPLPFLAIGSTIGTLGVALGQNVFNRRFAKRAYESAKEIGDIECEGYRYGEFLELQKEVQDGLNKDKLSEVANALLQEMRLIRGFSEDTHYYLTDSINVTNPLRHIISRKKARSSHSYEDYLRLILDDVAALEPALESDLEDAVNCVPERELEFRTLLAEYSVNSNLHKKRWILLYNALVEAGTIKPAVGRSKHEVGFVDCQSLGLQYVAKKGMQSSLEQEIKQTEAIRKGLACEKGIVIPEVVVKLDAKDLGNDNEEGVFVQRYELGVSLADKVRVLCNEDKLSLLSRAVKGNALASQYGLSDREENRYEKALEDISNLGGVNDKAIVFKDNISVCFKFADLFPAVYDRDGHGDNILIPDEERVILVDHEVRDKSDPVYMLIKLLEYRPELSYNGFGIDIRNQLIKEHFSFFEHNATEHMCKAHYYSSIILKAISYSAFTKGQEEKGVIRQSYLESAKFGLDQILSKYGDLYDEREIEMFERLREACS